MGQETARSPTRPATEGTTPGGLRLQRRLPPPAPAVPIPLLQRFPARPRPGSAGGYFRQEIVQNLPEVAGISQSSTIRSSSPTSSTRGPTWTAPIGSTEGPGHLGQELRPGAREQGYRLTADVNLDGEIDGFDLVYIALQFGKTVPPPEGGQGWSMGRL